MDLNALTESLGVSVGEVDYIAFFRFGVNTALATLALLVQRIIYPAFATIETDRFHTWHGVYTQRIGQIVAPLMLLQVGLYSFFVLQEPSAMAVIGLLLVLSTWIDTFSRAVPLHQQLSLLPAGKELTLLQQRLVKVNLPRTLLWIALVGLELLYISI